MSEWFVTALAAGLARGQARGVGAALADGMRLSGADSAKTTDGRAMDITSKQPLSGWLTVALTPLTTPRTSPSTAGTNFMCTEKCSTTTAS